MKKLNGLDKYVIFSISVLLIYTIVEMTISTISGISHDTVTTAVFSCFGGEILSCALIKIFKLKENGENLEFYKDE
jgi:hypothetical protein